jgi:hypothetical protein
MGEKMSLKTRKEVLIYTQARYKQASWKEKGKILDEFIAITGYRRKYAINLLNENKAEIATPQAVNEKRVNKRKYDEAIRQPILTMWYAANQICSKRLVPFIPDLLAALENFGHLYVPDEVRKGLLTISASTVDRLLESTRRETRKGLSTTRPGSLLKRQIKVRTFSDWNDVVPGFFEGDLVAHCGGRTDGSFLNTLVLTDIASTWTEFFPLLRKSEADVIAALEVAQRLLPFSLLGLDTDNGSEFINYGLLDFCTTQKITFTRSRAYKKNDQAHVEEKNGSIVRRLIGYDRYEGLEAYNALGEVYAVLRLYVNFFQPSLKLLSKTRDGAKVSKKYDKAKTPYQRILASSHICEEVKEKLRKHYSDLDPVELLNRLEKLQDDFWKHAWKDANQKINTTRDLSNLEAIELSSETHHDKMHHNLDTLEKSVPLHEATLKEHDENFPFLSTQVAPIASPGESQPSTSIRRYRCTNKPRKTLPPREWRTHKDAFVEDWSTIRLQLEVNPERTAKSFLEELVKEKPSQFKMNLVRTLQRRIAEWRKQQIKLSQEENYKNLLNSTNEVDKYVCLVAHAVTD